MRFESKEEREAVEVLCNVAQQAWDKGGLSSGDWPELENALKLINPLVQPDFDIEEFLG